MNATESSGERVVGAAVRARWPKLRQSSPFTTDRTVTQTSVPLDTDGTAVFAWSVSRTQKFEIKLRVSGPLMSDDPDKETEYRRVTAQAQMLTPGAPPEPREHVERWMPPVALSVTFTEVHALTVTDTASTIFADAVWAVVGLALESAEESLATLAPLATDTAARLTAEREKQED